MGIWDLLEGWGKKVETGQNAKQQQEESLTEGHSDKAEVNKNSEEEKKIIAATKIQSVFRGKAARDQRKKEVKAAIKIQSVYRGHEARLQVLSSKIRTSVTRLSVKSFEVVDLTFTFLKDLIPLMVVIFVIVTALGCMMGLVMNTASKDLLTEAKEIGFSQPWGDCHPKVRPLKPATMNNETFVRLYSKHHRRTDLSPEFPKMSHGWLTIFYVRLLLGAVVGYAAPWVLFLVMHGCAKKIKYVLILFGPLVFAACLFVIVNWHIVVDTGKDLSSNFRKAIFGGFSLLDAFVLLPILGRTVRLQHVWKTYILPFVILNVAILVLKDVVPFICTSLSNDWLKVVFRFVFVIVAEVFIAPTRIMARLVPLADEKEMRPEDKPFAVLPIQCIMAFWGRLMMMDLTDKNAIWVCSTGLMLVEIAARSTIVHRDKFVVDNLGRFNFSWCPPKFWASNAPAMKRFRCSAIVNSTVIEYVMIGAGAAFSYGSGAYSSIGTLLYNAGWQLVTEAITDGTAMYVEIKKHKMPLASAWSNRHKNWLVVFTSYIFLLNFFGLSHAGTYFCALGQHPDNVNTPYMVYCGKCG